MASLSRMAIEKGVRAFMTRDLELAKDVEEMDREIYDLQLEIENKCFDVIALHTPVASDLRRVSTSLKIVTDLHRIGRYAWDIAEFTEAMGDRQHFSRLVSLLHMAELVTGMVTAAVMSFINENADEARKLFQKDDEVDEVWEIILEEAVRHMAETPEDIGMGMYYILVARYLERIADHSVDIADRVIYMVEGHRIKQEVGGE